MKKVLFYFILFCIIFMFCSFIGYFQFVLTNQKMQDEFEYLKFDKHGSWIERGIKITEIQQDVNIETGTVTNSTTSTEYSIEEREITYY